LAIRDPVKERRLLAVKNLDVLLNYARDTIKGRWPEAEPHIVKHPVNAYNYARYVIKGRWPEAEPHIIQDPQLAAFYASLILKGRWPEAEPTIIKHPCWAFYYAAQVIKDRWPEAEQYIKRTPYWGNYVEFLETIGLDIDVWSVEDENDWELDRLACDVEDAWDV